MKHMKRLSQAARGCLCDKQLHDFNQRPRSMCLSPCAGDQTKEPGAHNRRGKEDMHVSGQTRQARGAETRHQALLFSLELSEVGYLPCLNGRKGYAAMPGCHQGFYDDVVVGHAEVTDGQSVVSPIDDPVLRRAERSARPTVEKILRRKQQGAGLQMLLAMRLEEAERRGAVPSLKTGTKKRRCIDQR